MRNQLFIWEETKLTDVEWLEYVRSLIHEPTPNFWSAEEVARYKQVGIIAVRAEFWNLLYPIQKKFLLCDMTAGDPYITFPVIATTVDQDSTIPTKVLYVVSTTGFTKGGIVIIGEGTQRQETRMIGSVQAGASLTMIENLEYTHTSTQADAVELLIKSQKIVRVEVASTGQKLSYIEDDELFIYEKESSTTPRVWIFEDGKIRQVPTPGGTKSEYYRVWYLPAANTLAELPEELHPLVAIEAVISAKMKDQRVVREMFVLKNHFVAVAMKALAISQVQDFGGIQPFDSSEEFDF